MIRIRRATAADVEAIVTLLADDHLGRKRESPADLEPYQRAFKNVDGDPNQFLAVAEEAGEIVGTMQLSFLTGLSQRGASQLLVQAVQVRVDRRGAGLGTQLMNWAIEQARQRGCSIVQLTSHSSRVDAHRFYERLGFARSHAGFKLKL
ncbi:GNAT family N-acetyltransferase [Amycolatopsis pithecellobii]|uniref:GNAT family N-acetyltransferase n=1 Tax=Amycolatopsis pithecellobii TaxID=664692 RepID=A0A6N7Z9F9_9PSEU|nr:GNAT family N-acetyltransferase [Amycolatopsis pithecellobii]MTD58370.1 GNAT family N-acetyltransferase [Amycolatopsis pithecellobii]